MSWFTKLLRREDLNEAKEEAEEARAALKEKLKDAKDRGAVVTLSRGALERIMDERTHS